MDLSRSVQLGLTGQAGHFQAQLDTFRHCWALPSLAEGSEPLRVFRLPWTFQAILEPFQDPTEHSRLPRYPGYPGSFQAPFDSHVFMGHCPGPMCPSCTRVTYQEPWWPSSKRPRTTRTGWAAAACCTGTLKQSRYSHASPTTTYHCWRWAIAARSLAAARRLAPAACLRCTAARNRAAAR